MTNHAGVRALTKCDLYRIDQDGFTRTCLTSQGGEASVNIHLDGVNNDEVFQRNTSQAHGYAAPSFQCNFLRSVSK